MIPSSVVRRWLICCLTVLTASLVAEPVTSSGVAEAADKKSSSKDSKKSSSKDKKSSSKKSSSKDKKSSSKKSSSKKSSKKSSSRKSSKKSKKSRREGSKIVIEAPSPEKGSPPTEIALPTRFSEGTTSKQSSRSGVPRNPRVISRQVRDFKPVSLEALFATREVGDYDWMPDGKHLLVVTNLSGWPNLWSVDTSGSGWPQQLTFHEERVSSPRVSPDGRYVAYIARSPNDDRGDVYLKALPDGAPVNLSRTADADEREVAWSPDGAQLAYTSDVETPGASQVFVIDVPDGRAPGQARRVSRSVQSSVGPRWHPDGDSIAVSRYRTPGDANVVLIDLKSGAESVLTPHEGDQRWQAMDWSPDGARLLITSDAGGTANVAVLDVSSRAQTWVTKTSGEALAQAWSPREDRIAWLTNNLGNLQLHAGTPREDARGTTLRIRKGQIADARFSPDGRYLAFRYAGPTRATDLWIYDLSRNVARQITFSQVSGIRTEHLVEPHLIHYPSFDGRFISGYLYVPHNVDATSRRPAVVWAHDGPGRQQQNGFESAIQLLVSRGYVVFAPNYRGSAGAGRAFERLNDLDWGGGDLQDLAEAAAFLKGQSYIDPQRIAVMGQGYGGYLSLLALTKTPDVWAAGIVLSGIPDLARYYQSLSRLEQATMRQEMGEPDKQERLWMTRSPVHFIPNIRVPVLLVHGERERRVAEKDVSSMAAALRQRGAEVEYLALPGDGASQMRQEMAAYRQVSDFLSRRLPVPAAVGAEGSSAEAASRQAAGDGGAKEAGDAGKNDGSSDGKRSGDAGAAGAETSGGVTPSGSSGGTGGASSHTGSTSSGNTGGTGGASSPTGSTPSGNTGGGSGGGERSGETTPAGGERGGAEVTTGDLLLKPGPY